MSYADRGLSVVVGNCCCFSQGEKQPARFASGAVFGSRRGHFNVNTNLVGKRSGHRQADLIGAIDTTTLSPLERVKFEARKLQDAVFPYGEVLALGLGVFGTIGLLHWKGVIDANKLSDRIFGEGSAK